MTRITQEKLYQLLPAIHRIRDAEEGLPLYALMGILAREGAVIEEDIEQLLDNQFIETCAPWVAPYLGGVIGFKALHQVDDLPLSQRTEVANTIGYRKRKGTIAVLEQLARDVSGWPAKAVEYFTLTTTCQHMNHIRPDHLFTPSMRNPHPLESLSRAFDPVAHTADMRSIQYGSDRKSIGGKYNFPNIGIFLWRLEAQRHSNMPTTQVDGRRYLFDPLGAPRQLINRPQAEDSITSLATPLNVPADISRRDFDAAITDYYGRDTDGKLLSFEVTVAGVSIPSTRIVACDLSDDGANWNHSPHDALSAADLALIEDGAPLVPPANALVRIDPVLGRIAFPNVENGDVRTSFFTGFPARIGGGEYDRVRAFSLPTVERPLVSFPNVAFTDLQDAIDALPGTGGIVEILTNDTIEETLTIQAQAGAQIELRAADGTRPLLRLAGDFNISGGSDARITIDGLVIEGGSLRLIPDGSDMLGSAKLRHVTLIPGRALLETGAPANPGAISLEVTATGVELDIERSITGPMRFDETTNTTIEHSLVDAASANAIDSPEGFAISGTIANRSAGAVSMVGTTVIGQIFARSFPLVSNSILFARNDTGPPVRVLQRQDGCVRYSYLPNGSSTPRRYRCQPQLAVSAAVKEREAQTGILMTVAEKSLLASRVARWLVPSFTALRYGNAAYAQLRQSAPVQIRRGASDESEMGVYYQVFQPQRETNLAIRIEEYLRFGLEAGVFFEN
ncbi:MAG: hypothetical protein V7750_16530 [Sneathiella sp.]